MKVGFFSPYGVKERESSLIYLVASFLGRNGGEVYQMRCNGFLGACGRDREGTPERTASFCTKCVKEQRVVAEWGGFKVTELGSFIRPDDATQTARLINTVPPSELLRLEFRGQSLYGVCQQNFHAKMGVPIPELSDPRHVTFLKALMEGAVHASAAMQRWLTSAKLDLVLSMNTGDFLGSILATQCAQLKQDIAVFDYCAEENEIRMASSKGGVGYTTKLLLDGLTNIKSDPRHWAPDITSVVNEIASVLGYGADRMPAAAELR